MQTALENPEIVSLAAGFVDQQSLPVEIAERAISELLSDPMAGRHARSSTARPSATTACGPTWSPSWSARTDARRGLTRR